MIKRVSNVPITPDWEVVKEIDFTTVPVTYTFTEGSSTGSATPELGNVDWTCRNLTDFGGGSSYVKFINGTGFQIYVAAATAASANWYVTYMEGLLISAKIEDLVPDFDAADEICIQTLLTSSFTGGNSSAYAVNGLIMKDYGYGAHGSATTTANWYGMQWYQTTAAGTNGQFYTRAGGSGSGDPGTAGQGVGSTHRASFYEIIATPASNWNASVATTGSNGAAITTFPTPGTTTEFRSMGNEQGSKSWEFQGQPSPFSPVDNWSNDWHNPGGLHLGDPEWSLYPGIMEIAMTARQYQPQASLNFTTTFTKMRILRRPRHD